MIAEKMRGYSTRDVSDLIGLRADQVYGYVKSGLLEPLRGSQGEYRFSFQDLVIMRTARGLLDEDVTPRRANRVLRRLKRDLPGVGPLASMRIFVDGDSVVFRRDASLWNAESGQGPFDFSVGVLAGQVAPLMRQYVEEAVSDADYMDSDAWYNLGLDLEDVDAEQAPDAYRRAIALNPENADAHVNLGRLLQLNGHFEHAERHYRRALESVPGHELGMFNLGTIHDEREDHQQAIDFYRRAPSIPDAHYNLSRIYQIQGNELAAARHFKRYQELTR